MPRADAPLQEVLVPAESAGSAGGVGLSRPASPSRACPAPATSDGPRADGTAGSPTPGAQPEPEPEPERRPRPDEPSGEWGLGDMLLAALFALAASVLLVASLVPGWEAYSTPGGECSAKRTCTYSEGVAFGLHVDPVAAVWVDDGREGCCAACNRHEDCVVGTFLAGADAKVTRLNCIMYAGAEAEVVALEGASLCSLPSDGSIVQDSLHRQLETLLGATAMLTRFGGFLFVFLLGKALEAVDYGGAGLVRSVLAPRQAGVDAAGIKDARQAAAAAVPERAGWDAIVRERSRAPSTWTEAREALGLSVRQAVWSCGSKLLLWHWAQPLSYFAVLGIYYCTLPDDDPNQRLLGLRAIGRTVAYREAAYLLSTLLALWLSPAYLLLELDPVLKPASAADERCCWCCCRRTVDWQAAKRWGVYLLAPHVYVTLCLERWAKSAGRCCVETLLVLVGVLQALADFVSVGALLFLLLQPSPPAALVIGYSLTTAGWIARLYPTHWIT